MEPHGMYDQDDDNLSEYEEDNFYDIEENLTKEQIEDYERQFDLLMITNMKLT